MSHEFIKDYWESQGAAFKENHGASWEDRNAIELEIEAIAKHIADGQHVLDAGCANGYSAFAQWRRRPSIRLQGIDYAQNMIRHAQERQAREYAGKDLRFEHGDIRSLQFADRTFDVVYTTRVLINLVNWAEQQRGIEECLRVAKDGGVVVLAEAFWEPLMTLNALRAIKQLPALIEHDFNRYLKKGRLEELLSSWGLEYTIDDFSSVYYLGSRFLRDLVEPRDLCKGFENPFNDVFFRLEQQFSGGGMGIQQAYVIRKR